MTTDLREGRHDLAGQHPAPPRRRLLAGAGRLLAGGVAGASATT